MDADEPATPRTCILCAKFSFHAGLDAYSERTPGSEWIAWCLQGHWDMSGDDEDLSEEVYRRNLLTARTCPDFVAAPLPPTS